MASDSRGGDVSEIVFSELTAADDIGLFVAGSTGGDSSTVDGMTTFMPIDQDASRDKGTVSKAGLKDADVICVGFRAPGAGEWLRKQAWKPTRPSDEAREGY